MRRVADKYRNFAELAADKRRDIDYRIQIVERDSNAVIIAPHGGWIEPGTSEIARAIANQTISLYLFEGLGIPGNHADLHITSTSFDEPDCCALVAKSDLVVAIHGRANNDDPQTVWVGGLDGKLRDQISARLERAGFRAGRGLAGLSGTSPANICNRNKTRTGVQLEIPRNLRQRLLESGDQLRAFSSTIRMAMLGD